MWLMIPSLDAVVQALAPAFTLPSFHTHCQLVLGWVLCLGQHRLCRVADSAQPQDLRDHSCRHGLDTTYNFFERSAWTPAGLGPGLVPRRCGLHQEAHRHRQRP